LGHSGKPVPNLTTQGFKKAEERCCTEEKKGEKRQKGCDPVEGRRRRPGLRNKTRGRILQLGMKAKTKHAIPITAGPGGFSHAEQREMVVSRNGLSYDKRGKQGWSSPPRGGRKRSPQRLTGVSIRVSKRSRRPAKKHLIKKKKFKELPEWWG